MNGKKSKSLRRVAKVTAKLLNKDVEDVYKKMKLPHGKSKNKKSLH